MTSSAELTILRFLAGRTHASAAEVGTACRLTAAAAIHNGVGSSVAVASHQIDRLTGKPSLPK